MLLSCVLLEVLFRLPALISVRWGSFWLQELFGLELLLVKAALLGFYLIFSH